MRFAFSHRLVQVLLAAILASTASAEAGTFKNPSLIDTPSDPTGIVAADFNHDGKLDLVYVDGTAGSTLHILLGNGDGTFTHGQDVALPAGICSYFSSCVINVGDVTKDGNLDLILGGDGTSIAQLAVLVGNGDGTFQAPIITTLPNQNGAYPYLSGPMAIGDVNGDGAVDLVAADNLNGNLDVLMGNSTGKFTLGYSLNLYLDGRTTEYVHDLNGDGHLDIVVNNLLGGNTYVLIGNGDGSFQFPVSYPSFGLLLADMDGDGHPDLVGTQYGQGVLISKGNPDGTFGPPSVVASTPSNALLGAIGDYNGDGIPDLVFSTPVGVSIALGQGGLTYSPLVSSVAGGPGGNFFGPAHIAQGDINKDGHNDIAVAADGGVLILLGNGDGSFASADFYDVGHTVGAAVVADFDGNGTPDIAVTVPATFPRLLLGTGTGTFSLGADQNQSYNSQSPPVGLTVGDFNGDGKPDLDLVQPSNSYPYGQSFVLFNTGSNRFSTPVGINAGPALISDLNGDGRSDLLFLSNFGITAMLGQANSTFSTASTPLWYATYGVAAVGDVNNDRKPDLLVYEGPDLRLWTGNGDGTFSHSTLLTMPSGGIYGGDSVVVADLDGDGNPDIVVTLGPNGGVAIGALAIFYGNGDATFQAPSLIPLSHPYAFITVADVNRDNRPDLILTDGGGIAVITNLGNRTFSAEDHYVAGQGVSQLNVVDVNGDGFPDIVAANSGGTTVTVLLNQPNGKPLDGAASLGVFTATPGPSNYSQPVTIKLVMSALAGSGMPTPTGAVSFYLDGTYLNDVSLAAGSASLVYSQALVPGTHTFVASYNGDSIYAASSFAVVQTVNPPVYATHTTLVASPLTVFTSQTVRLTATVTSSVPVPGGWVTFLDGANSLGAQAVDASGGAWLDTSILGAGTHHISAAYQGYQDSTILHAIYPPSTSSAVTVNVNASATVTSISASSLSQTTGSVVTFSATVSSGSGVPFGGVSFYDGNSLLGTTALTAAGTTTFSTASLTTGSHSITAVFNANSRFSASSSAALSVTANVAGGNLGSVMNSLTMYSNPSAFTFLVARIGSWAGSPAGTVTFLDSGEILGVAPVDSSGSATLQVSPLGAGQHKLSVSFSGNSRFAPAVSPQVSDQWPASGPGFSIAFGAESITVANNDSERVGVVVTPLAGFGQPVQLLCDAGVPIGYRCSLSATALNGGGSSYLTLQRLGKLQGSLSGVRPFYGIALSLFTLIALQGRSRRLRRVLPLTLGVIMIGCGNPVQPQQQQRMQVLSIQATSGSGTGSIMHHAQIIVKISPSD